MIITKPLLSEKSALKMDQGLYVLLVDQTATKTQIKHELKKLYNVDAISIRIVNLPAKRVSFKRQPGVQPVRHKAYVQLKPKQILPGFELPKEKSKTKADTKIKEQP